MRGDTEVRRRIAELEGAPPGATIATTLVGDLKRVTRIMEQVNDSWWRADNDKPPAISPVAADSIVATSETVSRIDKVASMFAVGPIDIKAQVWTAAGGESDITRFRPRQKEFAERHFVRLSESKARAKPKPWDGGLFTCTQVPGSSTTMWLMYQELYGGRSKLFPKPWYSYRLRVNDGVRVYEATSAGRWAELVLEYPLLQGEVLYPDWVQIARNYDAVHVTVPAIVAIQGLRLTTTKGDIAEAYWDAEQTLWLNWCFGSSHLLRVDN